MSKLGTVLAVVATVAAVLVAVGVWRLVGQRDADVKQARFDACMSKLPSEHTFEQYVDMGTACATGTAP